MRFLKGFGAFWYDFIIGDDWKIAVAVVLALAFAVLILLTGGLSDQAVAILGGVAVVVAFTGSLVIDLRSQSRHD